MFRFFYNLFRALFTGNWLYSNITDFIVYQKSVIVSNKIGSFIINALGGNFDTLQEFDWGITWGDSAIASQLLPADYYSFILSTIAVFGICFAVFGIVKKIFSIFFSGVR